MKATNFVGTIRIAGRTVEILPKIDSLEDAPVRCRLVEMLSVAQLVQDLKVGIASVDPSGPGLLDLYMRLYIQHMRTEWRRGQIRGYRREEKNRTALKGKLLFAQNLRRNAMHPERFFTRADQFTADIPASRVLKAALKVVQRGASRDVLRRDAGELLAEFEEVADENFTVEAAARIGVSRQHARFEPLLALARMLLAARSPDGRGGEETYALLFDMNVVFERYVGELMRRRVCPAMGLRADLQIRGGYLLREGARRCFALRPDIGIYRGRTLIALLDTKWKRIDVEKSRRGVAQADLYQAYAYGREYNCGNVVLLYPDPAETCFSLNSYRHHSSDDHCVEVATVSVGDNAAAAKASLIASLSRILPGSQL
ncbi:IQ calmodulin-binding-domain protein [soil metagenome]